MVLRRIINLIYGTRSATIMEEFLKGGASMSQNQVLDRVFFFDTTLRDGEQSPGCSMTIPEKLRMAHALEALGVDIIEAGFAIASPGDLAAVTAVSKEFPRAQVA